MSQDFEALFETAPGLYLELDPAFGIVAVTGAYLDAQVLITLIANAIKYNRRGGDVSVAVASVDGSDRVRISVADTGPGLDQASVAREAVPVSAE